MIVCIETSGERASLAIRVGTEIFVKESEGKNQHAEALFPLLDDLLKEAKVPKNQLSAIALSVGPGSYTGLRIGSAAAKSICTALNIPLIGISSLELLAIALQEKAQLPSSGETLFVPMIDARRLEVYLSIYDQELNLKLPETAHILSEQTPALWQYHPVCIGGSGASKCYDFLKSHLLNISIIHGLTPHALNMVRKAEALYLSGSFVDIVNFEPSYLKPFYTTAQPIQPDPSLL
jgi:tRNA threonylcarbamoyladenosine biosynthesis protein TsaB